MCTPVQLRVILEIRNCKGGRVGQNLNKSIGLYHTNLLLVSRYILSSLWMKEYSLSIFPISDCWGSSVLPYTTVTYYTISLLALAVCVHKYTNNTACFYTQMTACFGNSISWPKQCIEPATSYILHKDKCPKSQRVFSKNSVIRNLQLYTFTSKQDIEQKTE
jgi:hypothetical protein